MYPTEESQIHLRYMSDTSRYMYLGSFLRVTLDTYQGTSGIQDPCISDSAHNETP